MRVEIFYDEVADTLRVETNSATRCAYISLQQSRPKIARQLLQVTLRLLGVVGAG